MRCINRVALPKLNPLHVSSNLRNQVYKEEQIIWRPTSSTCIPWAIGPKCAPGRALVAVEGRLT